jgi:hypothetical protein
MLERLRLSNPPVGVLVAVFVLLGLSWIAHYSNDTRREYQTSSQEYEQSKQVVPFGGSPEGAYTDPKAYRDEWRQEHDLHAQRDMSRWALYMWIATMVGIGLVGATLFETRKAAQAAEAVVTVTREMGQRELRAYVTVTDVQLLAFTVGERIRVKVVFKNTGATPAYECTLVTRIRIARFPAPETSFDYPTLAHNPAKVLIGPDAPFSQQSSPPHALTQFEHDEVSSGRCALYFWGRLNYRDAFEADRWTTFRSMTGGNRGFRDGGSLSACDAGNDGN